MTRARANTAASPRSPTEGREGVGVGAPGTAVSMTTADLVRRYAAASEPGERMAVEAEMRTRWIRVTVHVVKAQENPDEVYVTAMHGGRRYKTARIDLRTGDRNIFWVPMRALAPVSGRIVVGAYDWDALSADDHISAIHFQDPFTPTTSTTPWDGAEYHTTVEFDR
jgi:hypothetical protein